MQKKKINKKRKINPKKFAQASKGQKIGYRWTVRERKIDGKERLVRVRRIKGKIEMQVLDDLRYKAKKPKKKISKPKTKKKKKTKLKPSISKEIKSERYFLFKGRIRIPIEKEIKGKTYKLHKVRDSSMTWATMESSSIRKKENCYAQAIKVKGYPAVYKRKKMKQKPKPKVKPKSKTEAKDEIQKEIDKVKKKMIKTRQVNPIDLEDEYSLNPVSPDDVDYTFDNFVAYPKNTEEYNLAKKYLKLRIKQSKMKIKKLEPKEHQKGKNGKEIWNSDIHYKIIDEKEHIDYLTHSLENLKIEEEIPIPKLVKPKVQEKTKPKKAFLSQKEQIKMLESMGKKFGKEDFDEINVLEYEEHHLGLMDPSRISLLTTNQGIEDSYLSKSVKDNKLIKVDWDNQEFSLSTSGKTVSFEEGCSYDLGRIQRALKSLDNPEMYCSKNKPLLIKDKNFSYVIAPRIEEKGFDEEGYPSEGEESEISSVMISPQEYKKYRKMTKKDLLEQLGGEKTSGGKYDSSHRTKDEMIIDLAKKNKPKPKPIWERSYTPFTKEQIEAYNRYTHYPLDINEDYKKAITSIENDVKKKLNLKDLKNVPEDIKKALNYCKKFYYQYYLATSRSKQIAPSWSVVGKTKYKGNVERANRIEKKASDDLQKSKKILESKVYKAINKERWMQPKSLDFGENNKIINKEIRDFRKEHNDIEIIQTASGSRTGKKWKLFNIKNKKDNKRYQIEISEDGSIDFSHFFGGRIATFDANSLNQFHNNLNKVGTKINA